MSTIVRITLHKETELQTVEHEISGTQVNRIFLLLGTAALCTCICLLLVVFALPIVMIVIGAVYFRECPVQSAIPLYLIIAGVLSILQFFSELLRRLMHKWQTQMTYVSGVFDVVNFVWLILGSYWVYSVYRPSFSPEDESYCNEVVYVFALLVVSLTYFIYILFIIIGIVLSV